MKTNEEIIEKFAKMIQEGKVQSMIVEKMMVERTDEILKLIKKHKKYFYDGIRDMPTDIGIKEMKNQAVNIFVSSILELDEKIMAMENHSPRKTPSLDGNR